MYVANGIIKLLLVNKHAWQLLRWYSAASLSSLNFYVNTFPAPIHHPDLLSKKILSPTERQDVSELTLDCLSALMNTTRKTEIVKERPTQRICCKEIYDENYWFSDPRNYRLSQKERGGRVNRPRLSSNFNLLWHKNGCRYPIKINELETSNAHVLKVHYSP